MIFLEYVGSRACLSAGKNCEMKKIPVNYTLQGFLFLVHSKNKHIKAFFYFSDL